jgi:N-carbamoyl-L-amino-acid hydrolase
VRRDNDQTVPPRTRLVTDTTQTPAEAVADRVDEARLRTDVEANAAFGAVATDDPDARGRTVRCGTDANRDARDRFVDRLDAAGLAVRVDAVGNVVGRWTPASADPDAAPVATGSHLDSVPEGGIFDGPLGVYAGLEAVRAMRDAAADGVDVGLARPVEVVSFTEEEGGRFADGLLGSSVAAGERAVDDALALVDDGDGDTTLGDALATVGYAGEGRVDAGDWDAWLELHVEQDTRLEAAGVPVGVVTEITGITHLAATIEGEANHAGATPMDERTDALAAAAEVILDVEAAARDVVATDSDTAVGTVGSCTVAPNATNVVPGRVTLGVDVRDVERSSMETVVEATRQSLSLVAADRDVAVDVERPFDVAPTPLSERVRTAARDAGAAAGVGTLDVHSGAAHDTMYVARRTDAGLLFAPSRDGVSHNPREWTDWTDCAAATRVLAATLVDLAGDD